MTPGCEVGMLSQSVGHSDGRVDHQLVPIGRGKEEPASAGIVVGRFGDGATRGEDGPFGRRKGRPVRMPIRGGNARSAGSAFSPTSRSPAFNSDKPAP